MGLDFSMNNIQGTFTKVDMVKDGQQANDRPLANQHAVIRQAEKDERVRDQTVSDSQNAEESRVTEDGGNSGRKQPFLYVRKRRKKEEKDSAEDDRPGPEGQGTVIDISV